MSIFFFKKNCTISSEDITFKIYYDCCRFPICLPPPVVDGQYTKHHGTDVSVTGWGCTDENCDVETLSRILQEVVMEVIPNDVAMCW